MKQNLQNCAVLWDMDGVLVDTGNFHYESWKEAFDEIEVSFDKDDFKKTFDSLENSNYPDNNCNAEMYCNEYFVELESLAPFVQLAPGEVVKHTERWEVSYFMPENLKERIDKI